MRLRRPCEHGFYDGHSIYWENAGMAGTHYHNCPGGEFLPEDAKGLTADLIEKALAKPDSKWSRGTILDAAASYSRILADG